MAKIVKNTTGSPIDISDTGVTVAASSSYTIHPQDYLLWAASSDIITHVGSGDIVINDGSSDLSISNGIDLVKGIFPNEVNITGISSESFLTIVPFASGGQKEEYATLNGDMSTKNMAVDGSVTSQKFLVNAVSGKDFVITDIVLVGLDGSIKLNNFLGQNAGLTNGCNLEIKANNIVSSFDTFKTTLDLAAFADSSGFDLLTEAGGDMAKTVRSFTPQYILRSQNTFGVLPGSDDYVSFTIQDNLTQVTDFRLIVRGYTVDEGVI